MFNIDLTKIFKLKINKLRRWFVYWGKGYKISLTFSRNSQILNPCLSFFWSVAVSMLNIPVCSAIYLQPLRSYNGLIHAFLQEDEHETKHKQDHSEFELGPLSSIPIINHSAILAFLYLRRCKFYLNILGYLHATLLRNGKSVMSSFCELLE